MLLPEDFRDRARDCLAKARRTINGQTRDVLIERAMVLGQAAVQAERGLALMDRFRTPRTLDELKRQLAELAPRQSVSMRTSEYNKLFGGSPKADDGWAETRALSKRFDCDIEFRPDNWVWFIKNPAP
jgi:hypothetical protein